MDTTRADSDTDLDIDASSDTMSFEDMAGQEKAVAILLDAEATSFLMMGSLSPGMKKHSVTLFEGGALRCC